MSDQKCRYLHFKRLSDTLTTELISLKSKFENAEFNFRKFDCSSDQVEKKLACQLRFKEKDMRNKGLGFAEIPPPFNQNYSSIPMSDEELLALPLKGYGPLVEVPINRTESVPVKICIFKF